MYTSEGSLKARAVLARTVFHVGRRVVVARRAVCAAQHFCIVADAVAVGIGCTAATTHAQGVKLVAVAIASACRNVRAAALVNLSRAVAHAASVKRPHAVVLVVAHPVAVGIRRAIATTNAHRVQGRCRRNRTRRFQSEHNRTPTPRRGRCTRRKRRTNPRSRPRRHTPRRRPHPQRSRRRTRPRRRVGCRCNRSRRLGCRRIHIQRPRPHHRTRRTRRAGCHCSHSRPPARGRIRIRRTDPGPLQMPHAS